MSNRTNGTEQLSNGMGASTGPAVAGVKNKSLVWWTDPTGERFVNVLGVDDLSDEDTEEHYFVNPCTKEVESEEGLKFDFWRFFEFNRLRVLLHQNKFVANEALKTRSPQIPPETLQKKFKELYGPVNFDADVMSQLLKELEESLHEVTTNPPDVIQLLDEGIPLWDNPVSELLKKVNSRFTKAEQEKFMKLRPVNSSDERLKPSLSHRVRPVLPALKFSGFPEGLSDPETVLNRIWHSVLCLLGQNVTVRVDDVYKHIRSRFLPDFSPLRWGHPKFLYFLNFCVQKFDLNKSIKIHRATFILKDEDKPEWKDFILIDSEKNRKYIDRIAGSASTTVSRRDMKRRGRIPRNFIGNNESIKYYADEIEPGLVNHVDVKTIHDPHRMACVLLENILELRAFSDSLREFPLMSTFANSNIPDYGLLKPGLYVMVHFAWCNWTARWFRARIIKKEPGKNEYVVYGIDFGFLRSVPLVNIRYMPREIADVTAFAIPVRLIIIHPKTKQPKSKWESCIHGVMDSLLPDGVYLNAKFEEAEYSKAMGCTKWTVACEVWKGDPSQILHKDLAVPLQREFLEALRRREERKEKRRSDKEKAKEKSTPKKSMSENSKAVESGAEGKVKIAEKDDRSAQKSSGATVTPDQNGVNIGVPFTTLHVIVSNVLSSYGGKA